MAEYLRRVDLVPPGTGPQRTHYWVELIDEPTIIDCQTAANSYLFLLSTDFTQIRAHLIDTQYTYIPPQVGPIVPERHIMKLNFAAVGGIAFVAPTNP
jgi:hypothetical protein